ncbi:helix-turn-helix transcriptional regulator [Achromobacter aloeverae]|uniref:Helix-turn-helix transcriptional regulator n=1 Tax=Achromobacter aloeverae TaxID=1750518 RepID=A0A4V1MSN4_9BURK|nr:response regulator transcription factor [Achromobacter aloeverae]RXN92650.1 helix-turn-helix transcriptional regulator [Achromobacter aloeverae]
MQVTPVLCVTHDDLLWKHWSGLDAQGWLPARGRTLADLARWREQRRGLAMIDLDVPRLPTMGSEQWNDAIAGLRVVVASPRPHDEQGTKALAAGAVGYCHTHAPVAALAQVLGVVGAGEIWMGRSLVQRLLRLVDSRAGKQETWHNDLLTERESMVARQAAVGDSNQEIAAALGITERTVKAHLSAVFEKLGVSDRLQLALRVHGISRA